MTEVNWRDLARELKTILLKEPEARTAEENLRVEAIFALVGEPELGDGEIITDWQASFNCPDHGLVYGVPLALVQLDGVNPYMVVQCEDGGESRRLSLSAMDGRVLDTPDARGGGSFTGPSIRELENFELCAPWEQRMADVVSAFMDARDDLPSHFYLHFMHAAEIIGYKHTDQAIRFFWRDVYFRMVEAMHCHAESEAEMDARLGDNVEGWLARCDSSDPAPVVPLSMPDAFAHGHTGDVVELHYNPVPVRGELSGGDDGG